MTASATTIRCDDVTMWLGLIDGRTVGVPLAWFPKLLHTTPEHWANCRMGATGRGLHWEGLDEDILVDGVLAGRGDMTVRRRAIA